MKAYRQSGQAAKNSGISSDEKITVVNPLRWKKIEYIITEEVDKSAVELQEGLEKIFRQGNENVLSGKSGEDYRQHIKELASAIDGQDYSNAERIIDRFFTGDKEKVIGSVKSLVDSVSENFWNNLRDNFKRMAVTKSRTFYRDGEKPEEAQPYVMRAIDKAKAASADLAIAPDDLADRVTSAISSGVGASKSSLWNAGQNRYSETAESVTAATAQNAKNNIFGGNAEAFAESSKKIEQLKEQAYASGGDPSDATVDEFVKETKRRDDAFSQYLSKGGEEYLNALKQELGDLKLASRYDTTYGEEFGYLNNSENTAPPVLDSKDYPPVELTMKMADPAEQMELYSPIKAKEYYGNTETEAVRTVFDFQKEKEDETGVDRKI
ncbi:hypothetical protein [Maridesulfovibrio sp. FT414]|uniref:hypothetical protein n=1 Tax=Maridesulfovibrio sp. FT414 TaxID=2979469 RepID=UPI003D807F1B